MVQFFLLVFGMAQKMLQPSKHIMQNMQNMFNEDDINDVNEVVLVSLLLTLNIFHILL